MSECGQNRDVGARQQRQVERGLDVWRAHDIRPARVDHDQPGALAQPLFEARANDRVAIGWVRADDQDHIGLLDGIEILCARGCTESGTETIAGRRMADARAGIDVVVAEGGADHFLDEEGFLVRAARRGKAANGIAAVLGLDALEFGGRIADGFLPAHLAPGLLDGAADHRLEDAVLVGGVTQGEAAFHAGMPAIGLAVLVGHHAHEFVATHLGLERASDAAIGAGRDDGMLRRADFVDRFLDQRRRGACLHAGAAGHAFGLHERLSHARRNAAIEATARDCQRKRALHFVAGAHAARADDALGRIVGEIGVGLVLLRLEVVLALIAVADLAQAHGTGHVLQFAVAVRRTGQAVERMIGDVQLHDAAPDALEPFGLRMHRDAFRDRCRAGSRRPVAAVDLHQTEPAGAELLDHIGGAQLRDFNARFGCRPHDRGAGRNRDFHPVDGKRHGFSGLGCGRSEIGFMNERHAVLLFRRSPVRTEPEIFGKMPDCAQDGIGREAAERAQRAELQRLA